MCTERHTTYGLWLNLILFRFRIYLQYVNWCELLLSAVHQSSKNAYMDRTTPRPKTQLGSITDETARQSVQKHKAPCSLYTYANGACVQVTLYRVHTSKFYLLDEQKNTKKNRGCQLLASAVIKMTRQSHRRQK